MRTILLVITIAVALHAFASGATGATCDSVAPQLAGLCTTYCDRLNCQDPLNSDSLQCEATLKAYTSASGGDQPPCIEESRCPCFPTPQVIANKFDKHTDVICVEGYNGYGDLITIIGDTNDCTIGAGAIVAVNPDRTSGCFIGGGLLPGCVAYSLTLSSEEATKCRQVLLGAMLLLSCSPVGPQ